MINQHLVSRVGDPLIGAGLLLAPSTKNRHLISEGSEPSRKGHRSVSVNPEVLIIGSECGVPISVSERTNEILKAGFRKPAPTKAAP